MNIYWNISFIEINLLRIFKKIGIWLIKITKVVNFKERISYHLKKVRFFSFKLDLPSSYTSVFRGRLIKLYKCVFDQIIFI